MDAGQSSQIITIGAKGVNNKILSKIELVYGCPMNYWCGDAGGATSAFGKTASGGKGATASATIDGRTYGCTPGGSYTSAGTTSSPAAGSATISWTAKTPGTGGGAGHIVPKQKVSVVPGDTYKVVVGMGGAGGALGSNGVGQDESMVSKLINPSGIIVLSSALSISTMGATGGNFDGTTVGVAGWINIGTTAQEITMDGFLNTNGEVSNGNDGGNGGTTTIEGLATLCSAGVGGKGKEAAGSSASGFGGCGGGGAGAGGVGGNGAPGYVKISWGE